MIGVNLSLSEADALAFREYMEYRDLFTTLIQTGVFNTKNGKAILHFDNSSTLQQITFDVIGWKKTHTQVA